jgi:WD40 repeat protein
MDLESKTIENVTIGSSISSLALSQNGKFIVAGVSNGTIWTLDTSSLAIVRTMYHGSTGVWSIAAHNDMIISGGGDRRIVFWNASTGAQELEVKASSSVRAISIRNDGAVAVGLYNGEISLIDPVSHNLTKLYAHTSIVRALAWSDDGSRLASVSSDKTLKVLGQNGSVDTFVAGTSGIFGVAWSGENIITAGTDEHVRIWSSNGSLMRDFKTGASVHSVSSDGPIIASGDIRGNVKLLSDTIPPSLLSSSLGNESTNSTLVPLSGRFSECATAGGVSVSPAGWLEGFDLSSSNGTFNGALELKGSAPDGTYAVTLNDVRDLSNNLVKEIGIGDFTLDRTDPRVITLTQSHPSPVPPGKLELVAGFSERMTGNINVTLGHNGSNYDVVSLNMSGDGLSLRLTLTLTKGMPGGEYTIQLSEGRDVAGNVMHAFGSTFAYDPEPPMAEAGSDITINAGESATLDASNSTGAIRFVWSIRGREYQGKVIEHRFCVPGRYPVFLTAFDAAGNSDRDNLTVYVIDDDLPNMSVERPKKLTNTSKLIIKYNITDVGGVSLVDVTGESAVAQPTTEHKPYPDEPYVDDQAEIPLPKDGSYNVTVKACDGAGNCNLTGPFETLRDSTPPALLSYSPGVASSSDIELILSFSEQVNVSNLRCSGGAMPIVLANGGDEIRIELRDLTRGENYTLDLRAQDAAGNALFTNISFRVMVDASDFFGPSVGFFCAGFTSAFLLATFAMKRQKTQVRMLKKKVLDRERPVEPVKDDIEGVIHGFKESYMENGEHDLL